MVYQTTGVIKMFKKLFSIVLVLVVLLSSSACTSGLVNKNMYTATVEADTFYIMSEIGGKVTDISLHQGDTVKERQNILKLDSTLYELQKKQAEAALKIAEASQSSLTEKPKQSIKAQSLASVSQAQSAVDSAQLQINKCTINSPVEGIIAAVYASKGQVVSPSSPTSNNIVKITGSDNKSYMISAEVSGRLKELNVNVGDSVKEGQNIARIDPAAYELQKKQALAALSAAKAQQSSLTENPKQSQLNQTGASVEQAQASLISRSFR
jgi:HlyD family secretion protein